jgi:ABC-2 type transport system permease protein
MFKKTLLLCRLILRRDWLRTILWFVGLISLVVGFAGVLPDMYPNEEERLIMADSMRNPAMVAIMGPVYGYEAGDENTPSDFAKYMSNMGNYKSNYTIGALYSNFMLLWTMLIIAIMNIFLVVRHTRRDEERGRIEVIRSLPVGRLSTLSAVLTTSVLLNSMIALGLGLGLAALGIESMDVTGSMLFGAVVGATGLLFAAVTAIFCQLCSNPRTAMSLSFAVLVPAYVVRGAGDVQNSDLLACFSPLGLLLRSKTYVDNLWWPVLAALLLSLVLAGIAFLLGSIRDMGEGLVPARPGKKHAFAYLRNAGGLAWRLLWLPFLIWAVVVSVLGMSYGSVMGNLESFISTNEMLKIMFPDGDPSQFISFLMILMAVSNTIPILQFILKARSQESGGYAENVLARSASRYSQLRGYFLIALTAGALMPFLAALGFWASSYLVMENPISFSIYLQASMAYVPAIWFMLGIAMLLIAFAPRLAAWVWAYLGYAFFVLYFGSMMQLPDWLAKLSPYGYIPQLPQEEFSAAGVLMLTGLAALMCLLGFIGYRKRDMKFS